MKIGDTVICKNCIYFYCICKYQGKAVTSSKNLDYDFWRKVCVLKIILKIDASTGRRDTSPYISNCHALYRKVSIVTTEELLEL